MTRPQEIIEFTRELVATPSYETEREVAQLVAAKLSSFGFSSELIGPRDHPSVICSIAKPTVTRAVWLESALDSVSPGDLSKWDYPPFEGKIVGNRMYGRGAADVKVAIALFCYWRRI